MNMEESTNIKKLNNIFLNISYIKEEITGVIGIYLKLNENARYKNLCDRTKAVLRVI